MNDTGAIAPQPRRILGANHDTKTFYLRMIWDEFAAGGLLAREDFNRNGLLFAMGIVRHVNGRTGVSMVGISKLAQDLGYESSNHGFHQALKVLVNLGFMTKDGKAGRAAKLRLSMPEVLRDKADSNGVLVYADLMANAEGDVVSVTDIGAPPTVAVAAPELQELTVPAVHTADSDWYDPCESPDEESILPSAPLASSGRRRPLLGG